MCMCHKCPCKFSFLVNVFFLPKNVFFYFFFTLVVYCMEKTFFRLSARLQTRYMSGMSPNPFRCVDNFSARQNKKSKKSSVRVRGRVYLVKNGAQ